MLGTILGYLVATLLVLGFGIAVVITILNELEITRFTTRLTVGISCACVGLAFAIGFIWWMVDTKTYAPAAFLYVAAAAGLTGLGFYFIFRK